MIFGSILLLNQKDPVLFSRGLSLLLIETEESGTPLPEKAVRDMLQA